MSESRKAAWKRSLKVKLSWLYKSCLFVLPELSSHFFQSTLLPSSGPQASLELIFLWAGKCWAMELSWSRSSCYHWKGATEMASTSQFCRWPTLSNHQRKKMQGLIVGPLNSDRPVNPYLVQWPPCPPDGRSSSRLQGWFSNWGPGSGTSGFPEELIRNANSRVPPQIYRIKLRAGPSLRCFNARNPLPH